jgi:hypothetical protein
MKIRIGSLLELVAMIGAGLAAARAGQYEFSWDRSQRPLQNVSSLASTVLAIMPAFALAGLFFLLVEAWRGLSPPRWGIGRLTFVAVGACIGTMWGCNTLTILVAAAYGRPIHPEISTGWSILRALVHHATYPSLHASFPQIAAIAVVAWAAQARTRERPDIREVSGRIAMFLIILAGLARFSADQIDSEFINQDFF